MSHRFEFPLTALEGYGPQGVVPIRQRGTGRGRPRPPMATPVLQTALEMLEALEARGLGAAADARRRWFTRSGGANAKITFVSGNDVLLDVMGDGPSATVRLDLGMLRTLAGHAGLGPLLAVGFASAAVYLRTASETDGLLAILDSYDRLAPEERSAVLDALGRPGLDAGGILARFLTDGRGQDDHERQRVVAWLRQRLRVDLPYLSGPVLAAARAATDLDSLRAGVFAAINAHYDVGVDNANAERTAAWCREEGRRLIGGRFSRALYVDAMLMACAQMLPVDALRRPVADLQASAARTLEFAHPSMQSSRGRLVELGGEVQRLANLMVEGRVSRAAVEGAIRSTASAVRALEASLAGELDSAVSAAVRRGAGADEFARLDADRSVAAAGLGAVRQALVRVETAAAEAPFGDPAFVVFFQRLFPLDAVNMGLLNELMDPFYGEDEEIHALLREGGHNFTVTPNLSGWLRHCDDWIEALPAYASYTIIPRDGGSYDVRAWVQRGILEDMYRRHADDWALNIEEVMALEHVAIARALIVERLGIAADGEEAIRRAVRDRGLADCVAALAAMVERAHTDLCVAVAARRVRDELSRYEALSVVLAEPGSPVKRVLASAGSGVAALRTALQDAVALAGLGDRAAALLPLAGERRRPVPSAHVLTTLGPGETELNIANWLEESMALFNVCRGEGLVDAVERRAAEYQRRLIAVGRRVIDELDLQGDLYALMQEEGMDPESESDAEQGILRVLASYPEVGAEAGRLALLLEHEGAPADVADEPECVGAWLDSHPEIEDEALRRVLSSNGLALSLDEGRAAVEADPALAAELRSTRLSMARGAVVASVGLADQVAQYVRRRLDRSWAVYLARREIVAERGLSQALNDPRYRYDSTGPFKKYNLLYTPSRVDLGAEEVRSVRDVPKWVGGVDSESASAGAALYSLYNVAGPVALPSPKLAEFLKVGENFFSRGGVFYLSLAAGANVDALGFGDGELFRDQWNRRGDRMVLPPGETYGGFCVPKEFSLLYAIITTAVSPESSGRLLAAFGVPETLHATVVADLRRVLAMRLDCADELEWEMRAGEFLATRYGDYFAALDRPTAIVRLTQLARTMDAAGVLGGEGQERRALAFELTHWINKKALGLEEINRVGPFRKVNLIRELVAEARKRNPLVAPDGQLIGVMTASYKEGERKNGREVPITDVRFSAGARKLEIYAGTAAQHILKDIDPEGREIVTRLFEGFTSPADIRIVGTCTGSDLLTHVPESGLTPIMENVLQRLLDTGLDESLIDANCAVYGGDLARWSGIKDLPENERERLITDIGPRIHLLVVARRGVYRTYEHALQGVDFVDLGIPDPELLDLIDNLPKLVYLMKRGRPNSALVFADGTSGARRRAFSFRYANGKRKVQELFALDANAVYGAMGLGAGMVDRWRQEMEVSRRQAHELWDHLLAGETEAAVRTYAVMCRRLARERLADEAVDEEVAARRAGVDATPYRLRSSALGRVLQGLPLQGLDFGTWLVLGGCFVLNGQVSAEELVTARAAFEHAVAALPAHGARPKPLPRATVDAMVAAFVRPRYEPPRVERFEEVETGIAGSLKAVEQRTARLEKRETRRRMARRAAALRERSRAFAAAQAHIAEATRAGGFHAAYAGAMAALGAPTNVIGDTAFGTMIAWTRAAAECLARDVLHMGPATDPALGALIAAPLSGAEVGIQAYHALATALAKAAERVEGDPTRLEQIAMTLELLDIALAIEKTQSADFGEELTLEIARFFDVTLNNHIFDCIPYHYHAERGAGFQRLDRLEKIALAERRHRWLYTYLRGLLAADSDLAPLGAEYADAWLGDADRGLLPLGVYGDGAEARWFSYARLRDASVLRHEGYPAPELLLDVDPAVLRCDQRANVVIVYPHGNTTVPVALEQGGRLAEEEGVNLFLCAWPAIVDAGPLPVLQLRDAFGYICPRDFERALIATGVDRAEAKARAKAAGTDGVLIAARFSRPVTAHGIFFHFTHPLRPRIGSVRAPLIQPIIWEAATHLKCRLPEMLRGSGTRTAPQTNWLRADSESMTEAEAKARIEAALRKMARSHDALIVKPEKESGGRNARMRPVREDGRVIDDHIIELRDLTYEISKTDNVAIQEVIKSDVRRLYTREFLEGLVDRFARIGVPVLLDRDPPTPLFSYFRQVLVRGGEDYRISHHITVVSTRGIANVGQGGLLCEYTDDIIEPRYRRDLRNALTEAARGAMQAQRRYLREHWREILDEYLAVHPEYFGSVPREIGEDLTGFSDCDIPYEMGDFMPVWLVDANDNLVRAFDFDREELVPLFDRKGMPTDFRLFTIGGKPVRRFDGSGRPLSLPTSDPYGLPIPYVDHRGRRVRTLVCYKIEANPGAGLWRPHNDQLPPERRGEGVRILFTALGQRAEAYKAALAERIPPTKPASRVPAGGRHVPASTPAAPAVREAVERAHHELRR